MIAADALYSNFGMTQSFGEMLADFLPVVMGESTYQRFSLYSKETCHERIHGKGTCGKFQARDGECQGTAVTHMYF